MPPQTLIHPPSRGHASQHFPNKSSISLKKSQHAEQWVCMGMPYCQEYFEYTPGVLRAYVKPKHLDALTFTLQPVIEAGNNHPIEPGIGAFSNCTHELFELHGGFLFFQSSCNDH